MRRAENPVPDADPPPTPPSPRSERDAARHAGGGEVVKNVPCKGVVKPLHRRGSAKLAVQPHHEGQRPLRVQPAGPEVDFRPVATVLNGGRGHGGAVAAKRLAILKLQGRRRVMAPLRMAGHVDAAVVAGQQCFER
jgi:hypothetical protein